MSLAEDRVQLRNPDPTKKGPRIAAPLYALLHRTALAVVPRKGPGITLTEFRAEVTMRLAKAKTWDPSASASWYAMAIKLDLEASGELRRVKGKPPQRLIRA